MPCWPAPCWWGRITNLWKTSKRARLKCGNCWTTVTGTTRTSAASSSASCTTTSRWTWNLIPWRSPPPPQPPLPAQRPCPCPAISPGTCNHETKPHCPSFSARQCLSAWSLTVTGAADDKVQPPVRSFTYFALNSVLDMWGCLFIFSSFGVDVFQGFFCFGKVLLFSTKLRYHFL